MASITLLRVRYDAHRDTPSPDLRITLTHTHRAESVLVAGGDKLRPGDGVSLDPPPFAFDDEVVVEVAHADGTRVGTFTLPEEPPAPNYRRVAPYTVSFRVEPGGRDVVDRDTYRPRICDARVARNSEICLAPDERAIVFAPVHNRAHLKYGFDQKGHKGPLVTRQATRDLYSARLADPAVQHALHALAAVAHTPWWAGPIEFDPADIAYDPNFEPKHENKLFVDDPRDATGSFQPGANALVSYYSQFWGPGNITSHRIDNGFDTHPHIPLGQGHSGEGDYRHDRPESDMRQDVLDALYGHPGGLSLVALFCHGTNHWFQLGGDMLTGAGATTQGLRDLAAVIRRKSREDVVVALYACATAHTHDGFAAQLRDLLIQGPDARPYCRVMGHIEVAHAYFTPDIRIFDGVDGAHAQGWDLAPRPPDHAPREAPEAVRFRTVRARIGSNSQWPAFRWALPFMSRDAIDAFIALDDPPTGAGGVFQMP